ncbi:MAG: CmpA/NrtA family ABC transporter substrate-binding protein, partial [Pseudomonadota bacterium]
MTTGLTTIRAGFIPLTDAAPLIVARTQGFAEREGIDLQLSQETSWATIRDRLAVGQLDVAHALAPLPIAGNLGLGPLDPSLIVPAALGFGGNTIVMATRHWDALRARGCPDDLDPARTADAVADYIRSRDQSGERRLSLGVVHPHSAHRYKLAYWLASRGILAGRDVDFVVLPPPLMSAALEAGRIDGFCAGEPWGSVATRAGAGVVLTTTAQIWRSSPEKVLAVRTAFADRDADSVLSLVRAIKAASVWCDAADNRDALADTLSAPGHVAQPVDVIRPGALSVSASASRLSAASHQTLAA